MSQISGPAPVAGSPRQAGVSHGSSPAASASRDVIPPAAVFAEGSLWAAEVAAISPRGFVLLVGGESFDVEGQPPVPEGAPLLVRARTEDGLPVFEVVRTPRARATEALRLALGHLLRQTLGAESAVPLPVPLVVPAGGDLAAALAAGVRERIAEPSPAVAEYLLRGILRLEVPVTTTDGEAAWQLEIDPDAGGGDAEHGSATSVALFSSLPSMGPVEARLLLSREDLSVRLVLASAEAAARVKDAEESLRTALLALGFRTVRVTSVASPARLARDRATDAVPHDPPAAGGLLDVRA